MINGAKSSIDIEQFYINNQAGQSLEPVLNALKAAAARGVQIRFLVDTKFYATYSSEPNELAQLPGFSVEQIDFSSLGGVQHAKYFVVDQTQAFVGSANFDWLALTHIHEVGLRINDANVGSDLEAIFNRDWANGIAIGSKLPPVSRAPLSPIQAAPESSEFLITASPPAVNPTGIPDTLDALVKSINSAKTSLKIQNYQYNTRGIAGGNQAKPRWADLDDAIRKAAGRGVHVQLCFDNAALKAGQPDLDALKKLNNVEVHIVTIPQWSGGPIPYARLIHSKYMIVDDASAWVGSENWTEGYFTQTRNVGVFFQDATLVSSLKQIFAQVWGSNYWK
jgi:phosphatidylserine/phosphatidylglycerophosphate/cardiolipin synthase-like enzyme